MNDEPVLYPRVLVVAADALGASSATGMTLGNLFAGWPVHRIAQVHGEGAPPSPDVCQQTWRISTADVPLDRFVRRLLGRRKEQILGAADPGLTASLSSTRTLRSHVHRVASAWADCLSPRCPAAFWTWVEANRPEVVYSTLGSIRVTSLVLQLARRLALPIVPHFMDDWPATLHPSALLSLPPRWRLRSRLQAIFRRSPLGMTISEAMAEEYRERYGIPFEAFMISVEVPEDCPVCRPDTGNPVRFVYVGGLHLNRWRALIEIGAVLQDLPGGRKSAELSIYAPPADISRYRAFFSAEPSIRLAGSLPADAIPRVLREADVLVHVESFESNLSQYTRLSLSTKLPQYMAAGRPILAYGPETIASCQYVYSSGCGILVGRRDADALRAAVQELATQPQRRRDLGKRGWQQARSRHSAEAVRAAFRSAMAKAAACGVLAERGHIARNLHE